MSTAELVFANITEPYISAKRLAKNLELPRKVVNGILYGELKNETSRIQRIAISPYNRQKKRIMWSRV